MTPTELHAAVLAALHAAETTEQAARPAAAAYAGVRRIIQRHAPMVYGGDFPPCCSRCEAPVWEWPCADYIDATAVIPDLPEEVARALRQ